MPKVVSGCVAMTPEDVARYPPMVYTIKNNVTVSVAADLYIRTGPQFCVKKGEYSLSVFGSDSTTILGDSFMQVSYQT